MFQVDQVTKRASTVLFTGVLGLLSAASAFAATPTVFSTCPQLFEVNGLAATQNKLLFTTQDQSNVFQIDASGTNCTLFAVVPPPADRPSVVVEEYLAISPGLGGFPAGWIFLTQYEKVFKISPDGSTVSLFATIPTFTNHIVFHSGITFDTSGNYGFKMIVTGQNKNDGHGEVYTVDSSGTPTLLASLTGGAPTGITEGPQITLPTFTPAPSRLIVSQEHLNQVLVINPNGSVNTLNTLSDISGTNVIPTNVCALVGPNASFFTTDWRNGRILKYAAGDVPPGGGVLLPVEDTSPGTSVFLQNNAGVISVFDGDAFVGAATPIVHEGSTFVTCNTGVNCPASPGFWKKHAYPAAMIFPVVIGGISYSKADFNTILNNPGGGNAVRILGFQLAAALLNAANGASVPANVSAAIADAESLLTGISLLSGFVAPSSAPGQKMIADAGVLDTFNNNENCH
jgi:hypothetical protein